MRRLARWTLNALTVLSLLLCVATVGLWVQSYFAREELTWHSTAAPAYGSQRFVRWEFRSAGGGLSVEREYRLSLGWMDALFQSGDAGWEFHPLQYVDYPGFTYFAFTNERWGDRSKAVHDLRIVFPTWCLVLAASLLPVARGARRYFRRVRQTVGGRCPSCRYDLTGNVSGVCPECGTSVAKTTSPPAESFR